MTGVDALEWARAEFGQRSWSSACSAYGACSDLAATDLEAWGLAAFLTGQDDTADSARERAHHAFVADGDLEGASRTSFWLGLSLMMRGEPARGAGWFARMRTAAGDGFEDSVWRGYDSLNRGMGALFAGENQVSARALRQAIDVAARYGDDDLRLLAASGHGQALLAMGQVERGMEELDEVMVLATSGSAGPQAVGQVYCAVISVCRASLDLGRGAEWTEVLSRWCESQPDLVPYRGQCLVHRSEVLQVRGRWDDAVSEAEKVFDGRSGIGRDVAAGMAHYQCAELHRLRGDHDAAERGYRAALAAGHDPQPGLALLRLAQGKAGPAVQSLQRALLETHLVFARAHLLPALVDAAIALGDLELARQAADELSDSATSLGSAFAWAIAATSAGSVAVAEGRPEAAITSLREALGMWAQLAAPYDAARCRLRLARACRELGDAETADLELAAARRTFVELGAKEDLAVLDGEARPAAPGGLTPREVEVLGLVATGASNRDIAAQLVLSEKTVARHVANIFLKIGVSTRAAATAFAYDKHLV